MTVTWSIIRVLYLQFGNKIRANPSSLNETLDFISVIKETEMGYHTSDKKLAEVVFGMLTDFPQYDPNHYVRQKSSELSMWTLESLKIIAKDFKLFVFCYDLINYLGCAIDFKNARKAMMPGGREFLAKIDFVSNEIVEDVIKEINLF